MDQILDSPVHSERQFHYAGFWIRVAANVIDSVILSVVNGVVISIAVSGGSIDEGTIITTYLGLLLINMAYFVFMESSEKQGTLGKMGVGIKIGKSNGERISIANAFGRYFARILSGLVLCIGFIMVAFDAKKQGLHDKLADTYVYYA